MTDENQATAKKPGKHVFVAFNIIMLIVAITGFMFVRTLFSSGGDDAISTTLFGISAILGIWAVGNIIIYFIGSRKHKNT